MAYKLDENGNQILDQDGNPIPVETNTDDGGAEALKRQIADLTAKEAAARKDAEFQKEENARLEKHKETVLEEKRAEVAKRKALEAMHEGLTPEQVSNALKRARDGDEAIEQQVRDIVKDRMTTYKEDHVEPLKVENQDLRVLVEGLRTKLSNALVSQEIVKNAKKYGVKSDMYGYAEHIFSNRIGVNQKGDKVYKDRNGHEVDNINWEHEFIKLKETTPSMFDKNKGSNANGGGEGVNDPNQVNPWKAGTKNFTMQLEIETTNPDLAEKLKKEAGVKT